MNKIEELYTRWQSLQPLSERKRYLLSQRFTVDYNFNSNHIEGNTLTYGQTELLLLLDKVSGEGRLEDYVEMKASQVGQKMMESVAIDKSAPLTQSFIRQLHKTLLREDYTVYRNLPGGMHTSYVIHAGIYKTRPNSVITRYGDRFEYASPEETPALMSDLVEWYNDAEQSGELSPIELAALFHYRYIRIHPFEDGNGRIARLLVNYILVRHNWPMIVVRARDKFNYLESLHKTDLLVGSTPAEGAHANITQIKPFYKYFSKIIASEMRYNIEFVEETSPDAWWYDGKRIAFRSKNSPVILDAIYGDSEITIEKIAKKIGIVPLAVQKQLKKMEAMGYIQRRESDRSWYIFASRSI